MFSFLLNISHGALTGLQPQHVPSQTPDHPSPPPAVTSPHPHHLSWLQLHSSVAQNKNFGGSFSYSFPHTPQSFHQEILLALHSNVSRIAHPHYPHCCHPSLWASVSPLAHHSSPYFCPCLPVISAKQRTISLKIRAEQFRAPHFTLEPSPSSASLAKTVWLPLSSFPSNNTGSLTAPPTYQIRSYPGAATPAGPSAKCILAPDIYLDEWHLPILQVFFQISPSNDTFPGQILPWFSTSTCMSIPGIHFFFQKTQ